MPDAHQKLLSKSKSEVKERKEEENEPERT
jgi:hypothetical protein